MPIFSYWTLNLKKQSFDSLKWWPLSVWCPLCRGSTLWWLSNLFEGGSPVRTERSDWEITWMEDNQIVLRRYTQARLMLPGLSLVMGSKGLTGVCNCSPNGSVLLEKSTLKRRSLRIKGVNKKVYFKFLFWEGRREYAVMISPGAGEWQKLWKH